MALLGAHESVAGGLHLAFERIASVGGESLQIFTRNQRQWRPKPLTGEERDLWLAAWQRHNQMMVASHASYLVNLASGKAELRRKSVEAMIQELDRCHQLRIPYVVLHPGSHGGDGEEVGLARCAAGLDEVLAATAAEVMVLLETTAGQGTALGASFEQLAAIRSLSRYPERLGVCVDTCHIFAAGYDIRTPESYTATIDRLAQVVGLEHVKFFHLNDSKKELASRVDRHEHIGRGALGLEGFRLLLNDPRFRSLPMTLETPKGDDLAEDRDNLRTLRSLYGQA